MASKRVIRPKPERWHFGAEEDELAASASGSLFCLEPARLAVASLADTLCQAPAPPRASKPSADFHRKVAILQLGALGVRSALALITLVCRGYEAEAHGLRRRLHEIFSRGQIIAEDSTGEQARRWLDGRDAGAPGRVAARVGALEEWRYFSTSSHADSAGIAFITSPIGPPGEAGEATISLKPSRIPLHGNGLLFDTAYETAGMMAMIAEVFGTPVQLPGALSEGILEARRRLDDATRRRQDKPSKGA